MADQSKSTDVFYRRHKSDDSVRLHVSVSLGRRGDVADAFLTRIFYIHATLNKLIRRRWSDLTNSAGRYPPSQHFVAKRRPNDICSVGVKGAMLPFLAS